MSVQGTPPHSRSGSPPPGAQSSSPAPLSPNFGSQGTGLGQPPLPAQPPSPLPIISPSQFDVNSIQEIIDGTRDLTLSDFQSLMGQLNAWLSVVPQFERVEKETVNSIYHFMAKEDGSLALPYSKTMSKINPYHQTSILIRLLSDKFKLQCPHFNFDTTMSGSLSTTPTIVYKRTQITDSGGLLLISNQLCVISLP